VIICAVPTAYAKMRKCEGVEEVKGRKSEEEGEDEKM